MSPRDAVWLGLGALVSPFVYVVATKVLGRVVL